LYLCKKINAMEKIFVYGTATAGKNFTNRKKEIQRISMNFRDGMNTIIISPRRWGKTSLVRHVANAVQNKNLKIVFLDIFACKTEEEFFKQFSKAIIQQTSNKWEEWVENTKKFLSNINIKFTFGKDPLTEFSMEFELNKDIDPAYILNLPERIAQAKNIKIVVCIDEFQQIGEFKDSKVFQKKLRTQWQLHQKTSYCLFGSKRHLMIELFENKSLPFYKFGDIIFLEKIDKQHLSAYIQERFSSNGKKISEDIANQICDFTDCHSSYTQQLAWLVWGYTKTRATKKELDSAIEDLLAQTTPFFQQEIEPLTFYQLNFVRALKDGICSEFYRKEISDKYNLGTTANIKRIITTLQKREIISIDGKNISIEDPIFEKWLKINLK